MIEVAQAVDEGDGGGVGRGFATEDPTRDLRVLTLEQREEYLARGRIILRILLGEIAFEHDVEFAHPTPALPA